MSGDTVSRDELKTMIEVQSKNVEQLTVIANHLNSIVERETKIYERLYNGISKEISSAVIKSLEVNCDGIKDIMRTQATECANTCTKFPELVKKELDASSISKDVGHMKWFVSIIGVLIVIASIIVNMVTKKAEEDKFVENLKKAISSVNSDTRGHSNNAL